MNTPTEVVYKSRLVLVQISNYESEEYGNRVEEIELTTPEYNDVDDSIVERVLGVKLGD